MAIRNPRTKPKTTAKKGTVKPDLFRVLARIGESVPTSERAKIPTDISQHVDHYLYGSPKED
jgi:hypothetical protein